MTERPIIFSASMVRALLEGRKTQTRRIINPQPDHLQVHTHRGRTIYDGEHRMWCWKDLVLENIWDFPNGEDRKTLAARCPHGQPGDKLWVRENWSHTGEGVWTIADARTGIGGGGPIYAATYQGQKPQGWWPSIHMPREFSRITLDVTEVRVQRLQEINEEDAIAEGAKEFPCPGQHRGPGATYWTMTPGGEGSRVDPRLAFKAYFEELHGEDVWLANPFVWAVSFPPLPAHSEGAL